MAHETFSAFLSALERAGELIRVADPVATELEITALADREMKKPGGGRALLFEQPTIEGRPAQFPLAINTMGSESRMAMALGIGSIDELVAQMTLILKAKPPTSFAQALSLLRQGMDLLNARPKKVRGGPCKEVIHRFDPDGGDGFSLADLPVLLCWPKDGGRFITLPNVHTRDPDTGTRNLGMYRMQVFDGRTTGMHWQVHKVGARHGKRYYERGERMPVAVCLGGDPAHTFAATAPLPDGLDEILFSGFARKRPVELVRCETVDLDVPADSDFVLEGYVLPARRAPRARSAITPGSTRRSMITRSSTSRPSPTGNRRCIRRRWSACRRWKIFTSATPASASSSRSFR
jgi:4-hydroxy-3-polyprenylbenzoate decarboxylase